MYKRPINVIIADDHTLFRKGLVMVVSTFENCNVVADFSNGQEALEYLRKEPVDLILLDLDMPEVNGYDTARKIIASYPKTHIIIISSNSELEVIAELIEIGVHSYLLKDAEPAEVLKAIQSVINNDFYYNQVVSKALRQNFQKTRVSESQTKEANLTKREIEVLTLICQEMTVKEISEELILSEQTILTHRKHLMKKIQAKNAVSLVRFAIQNQIISFV